MPTAQQVIDAGMAEKSYTFSDAQNPAGVHVAVGYDPFTIMKKDGAGKWQVVMAKQNQQLTDICWSQSLGLFLAAGYGPDVFISSDGATWTRMNGKLSDRKWINICWSPDLQKFFGVSTDGEVFESSTGVGFSESTAGLPIQAVGWVDSLKLVAIIGPVADPLAEPQQAPIVLTSADGVNWTQADV